MRTHTIHLTTTFGNVVASEEVPEAEFGAALRRIHGRAASRADTVVEVDGVVHTRNSFLQFVQAFNECMARARAAQAA
jgi:hypothetical protein